MPEKIAIPELVETVCVPVIVPLLPISPTVIARPESLVTVLPKASCTAMRGCVDRTAPLALELEGCTLTASLLAAPGVRAMFWVAVMSLPPSVARIVEVPAVVLEVKVVV